MPSFKTAFFAVAAAFVATASAQDYYIDPETVPSGTRARWCDDQKRSCDGICAQTDDRPTLVNTCNSDALNYGCICGDGNKPNMTEYSLTLPYHICMEWGNQCVTNCGLGANSCAASCREDHPCGAQDPERVNATSSTATPSATPSSTSSSEDGIFTGLDGASGEDGEDSPSAAPVMEMSRTMGMVVLVGGLFGSFAFLL